MKIDVKTKNNFIYRFLCGVLIGISIIAPGISGSIMAVMMGIYDELINIISNPFKNFKKNCIYILPMCIGAVFSIGVFLQLFRLLFYYYKTPAFLLFISLIAGSMPTVLKEANSNGFNKKFVAGILGAFIFAITIGLLGKNEVVVAVDTTAATEATKAIYFPLCGGIAGITSMIPGMSVSMVLMMFNVYTPLLEAAANFDILTIAPVAICFLIGMILFSKLTKIIFRRFHNFAYFMVFGFMSGTLISIFPPLPVGLLDWILSVIAISIGIFTSILFRWLGKKFNTENT